MADRRIVRQKFDTWIKVEEHDGQFYQVLPRSAHGLRHSGSIEPGTFGESVKNGFDPNGYSIQSIACDAVYVSRVEGEHLFALLSTFDDATMGQLVECWRENDPTIVVNLMDYYG